MKPYVVTREVFLRDQRGRTFADVANDADQAFDEVLAFFSCPERQRRMEEAEVHHDRAPLAGVVRELESRPALNQFFSGLHPQQSKRLRQAIGVVVRMIMEGRGWKKTGRKGSLGVRAGTSDDKPAHNSGGLALWFIRAERYELPDGMPYLGVAERSRQLAAQRRAQQSSKP
ncbi:MAG: hypothetical protein KDA44_12340 [Planctomycetales bacterium]|nr:hypothetical protein [Planctomycetales bacterium]